MYRLPEEEGAYPVTPVGSVFGVAMITSVVTVPVALVVTTDAQVPELIPPVPIVEVPLATTRGIVELTVGNVIVVPSVPASVRLLLAVNVFPSAIAKVALEAGGVIATLLIDVAVATPKVGVVKAAFVIAVPLVNVVGKSPAAMAENDPIPPVAVACRT